MYFFRNGLGAILEKTSQLFFPRFFTGFDCVNNYASFQVKAQTTETVLEEMVENSQEFAENLIEQNQEAFDAAQEQASSFVDNMLNTDDDTA